VLSITDLGETPGLSIKEQIMKTNPAARIVSFQQDASRSTPARRPTVGAIRYSREPTSRRLTTRELEVLALLCEGLPNKVIQRRLAIGAGTVKCHVGSILDKLGVGSRLQAVVAAHRMGLLNGSGGLNGADPRPNGTGASSPPWMNGEHAIEVPATA
jgi:ATP/maltotriose-dependent transcriptional regulator MalT